MNILEIHNKYKIRGGENVVFDLESNLLRANGHKVQQVVFDNRDIVNVFDKAKTLSSVMYNRKSASVIEDAIKSFNPDVVHVHNFYPIASPSIFYMASKLGVPTISTLHNFRLVCPGGLLYRDGRICTDCVDSAIPYKSIVHKCYRNSATQSAVLSLFLAKHNAKGTWKNQVTKFIVLTELVRDILLSSKLNILPEQITIKPNFVEDQGIGHQRQEFYLFVGRISEEKGIATLLEAFTNSSETLHIIGAGPLEGMVQKSCSENQNIKYFGLKDSNFVIEQMKKCKALVFPSLWYEGMPMTILEAFSCGTPVIASDIGAMKELIINKKNGLHFTANNPMDLSKKLKLIEDEMYTNARNTYLEKYSPANNYKKLIQIYEEAISAKKANL